MFVNYYETGDGMAAEEDSQGAGKGSRVMVLPLCF